MMAAGDNAGPARPQSLPRAVALDFGILAAGALVVFCYAALSANALADGDTGWHLMAGQWVLQHLAVPRVDPFSYTFAGQPWQAHEWLSQVILYLGYAALGWGGLLALVAAFAAALFAIVALEVRRWLPPPQQLAALAMTAAVLAPFLLARPHFLVLPLLAFWTVQLQNAARVGAAPPIWAALLMTLWSNMHGSFVFGLGLLAPYALEAMLQRPGRRARSLLNWAAFGAAATLAALLNPHGISAITYPLAVSNMWVTTAIGEWLPTKIWVPSAFTLSTTVVIFVGLWRRVRIPIGRLGVLLLLIALSLQHERHQALLAAIAPILLAEPFGRALQGATTLPRPTLRTMLPQHGSDLMPAAAVLAAFALAAGTWSVIRQQQRPDSLAVPTTCIARLPRAIREGPVFNEYSFGGSLILAGIRPYIDGRADLFGDRFTRDTFSILDGDEARWKAVMKQRNIQWTILPPNRGLVRLLDRDRGWRRIYADRWAIVHERVSSATLAVPIANPVSGP